MHQALGYDNNVIKEFYTELHSLANQTLKQDILVVQELGMQKWEKMHVKDGGILCTFRKIE